MQNKFNTEKALCLSTASEKLVRRLFNRKGVIVALALFAPAACDEVDESQDEVDESRDDIGVATPEAVPAKPTPKPVPPVPPAPPVDECPASIELVDRGNFEDCGQNTVNAGIIPGWAVGGKVDWWKDSGLDGCAVDLSGTPGPGSLTQTLTTVPGARYDLLVDARPNDGAGPKTTTVVLKAGSTSSTFKVKSKTQLKLSFVAETPLTVVSLTSLDQGKYGTFVDNVSVVRSDLVSGGGFDGCNGNTVNATAIPGWTVKGGVDWWKNSGLTGCGVDLSGTPGPGAISQTLTTKPGWEYQLRVDANPNLAGGSPSKSVTLRAGGTTQEFLLTEKKTLSLNFVATADTTEIELASSDPGNFGTFVDNVSLVLVKCDDGCSTEIPVEPPPTVTLFGTVRDFQFSHPDFEENKPLTDPGIVLPELGADDKPVFAGTAGNPTTSSQAAFDQWFRDVPGVNQSKPLEITLDRVSDSPPIYRYSNLNFFPIDDQLLGNEGAAHNYAFTYEIATQFEYRGNETFKFSGDDDVFIYINRQLVLDLGGVHGPLSSTVSLDAIAGSVGLEVGKVYPLHLFFAERQTTNSQFEFETSIESLTECVD